MTTAQHRESPKGIPIALDPNFTIELPAFEGPLDLLLHLIQKHELDILDLPIAFVTERYLSYIDLMEKLDLDIAAEYLVMAAKLAHIKSKMLLPSVPDDQDDDGSDDDLDPREDLIRRLLEYQKYKQAAESLGARGVAGRDVFMRGVSAPKAQGPAPLAEVGIFRLIDAFQEVLKRLDDQLAFEISADRMSIQERMTELTDILKKKRRCSFDELFASIATRYELVITFMAVLEMAKMRMMRVYQADPQAPLHIEYRITDVTDAEIENSKSEAADGADGDNENVAEDSDIDHEHGLDANDASLAPGSMSVSSDALGIGSADATADGQPVTEEESVG